MKVVKYISKKDKEISFYIPKSLSKKDNQIELSIVIPAYNEKKTIKKFLSWCKKGVADINLQNNSEIIIIDSSNDGTDQIALENGAKVVKTPLRGLGRAYLDGMEFVSGKFMILGDADCTYDFRNLNNFFEKFKENYDFIMGSRRKGFIEKNSMPKLHRYFGIPITNFLLNFIFKSRFSDIHCGMRGITKKAFLKMNLNSQKWGYASEMLIKAIRLKLKSCETPINFYVASNHRQSVHVREGWLSPWLAGIQNVNQMLIFGSDFIFRKISYSLFFVSSIYFFVMIAINNKFIEKYFQYHWSFLFFTLLLMSFLLLFFSNLMFITYQIGLKSNDFIPLIEKKVKYNLFDILVPTLGLLFISPTLIDYFDSASVMNDNFQRSNLFFVGLALIILSSIKFFEFFYYSGLRKIFNIKY